MKIISIHMVIFSHVSDIILNWRCVNVNFCNNSPILPKVFEKYADICICKTMYEVVEDII